MSRENSSSFIISIILRSNLYMDACRQWCVSVVDINMGGSKYVVCVRGRKASERASLSMCDAQEGHPVFFLVLFFFIISKHLASQPTPPLFARRVSCDFCAFFPLLLLRLFSMSTHSSVGEMLERQGIDEEFRPKEGDGVLSYVTMIETIKKYANYVSSTTVVVRRCRDINIFYSPLRRRHTSRKKTTKRVL